MSFILNLFCDTSIKYSHWIWNSSGKCFSFSILKVVSLSFVFHNFWWEIHSFWSIAPVHGMWYFSSSLKNFFFFFNFQRLIRMFCLVYMVSVGWAPWTCKFLSFMISWMFWVIIYSKLFLHPTLSSWDFKDMDLQHCGLGWLLEQSHKSKKNEVNSPLYCVLSRFWLFSTLSLLCLLFRVFK